MKLTGTGKRHAATLALPRSVTNATFHDEIKLLRADNKLLSVDVRT